MFDKLNSEEKLDLKAAAFIIFVAIPLCLTILFGFGKVIAWIFNWQNIPGGLLPYLGLFIPFIAYPIISAIGIAHVYEVYPNLINKINNFRRKRLRKKQNKQIYKKFYKNTKISLSELQSFLEEKNE